MWAVQGCEQGTLNRAGPAPANLGPWPPLPLLPFSAGPRFSPLPLALDSEQGLFPGLFLTCLLSYQKFASLNPLGPCSWCGAQPRIWEMDLVVCNSGGR